MGKFYGRPTHDYKKIFITRTGSAPSRFLLFAPLSKTPLYKRIENNKNRNEIYKEIEVRVCEKKNYIKNVTTTAATNVPHPYL